MIDSPKKHNWQTKKLNEVCNVEYGTRVVRKRDGGSVYPVHGGGGKTFFLDTYNRENCMVIARFAMSEQCTRFVKDKFFLNDSGLTVFPKNSKDLDQDFLDLQLIFLNDHIYSLARGAAQKNLDVPAFRNMVISYPKSLFEQHRIVKILDKVFENIDKAKENAEKNLQNSKELFESYLQSIFTKPGKDWEEKRLGEVCELTRGQNPPKSKFINEPRKGYVRFYQIRDGWSDNYPVYVPDKPQLHKITPDDILMVAYRHIGKAFRGVTGAFNVALCKISNKRNDILYNDFLFYMIPTDIIRGELMKRSGRSLIPSMSIGHLKEIIIPLPSLVEQKSIVAKLDVLSAETKKLEGIYKQKLADLEELKKSVLKKAFSGEL